MILECPQCHSRYLVPDGAIGTDGRTVRCANCRHSWFQEGSAIVAAAPVETAVETAVETIDAPAAEVPSPIARSTAPGVTALADPVAPAFSPTPFSPPSPPFATPPVDEAPTGPARRDPARRWTVAAVTAGLLMIAGVGIILWSSAPGLLAQLGLPIGAAQSPLRLVDNPIERRDLANGSELFAVSGKVLNPSTSPQRVPDIRADLRDSTGRIVFSWTITPQQRTLGPKSAIDFNSAKLDVPATSKRLELSFVGEDGG